MPFYRNPKFASLYAFFASVGTASTYVIFNGGVPAYVALINAVVMFSVAAIMIFQLYPSTPKKKKMSVTEEALAHGCNLETVFDTMIEPGRHMHMSKDSHGHTGNS